MVPERELYARERVRRDFKEQIVLKGIEPERLWLERLSPVTVTPEMLTPAKAESGFCGDHVESGLGFEREDFRVRSRWRSEEAERESREKKRRVIRKLVRWSTGGDMAVASPEREMGRGRSVGREEN